MNGEWKMVWAVEWENNGIIERFVDYQRHSTPEEAKLAFTEQRKVSWEEAERKGARLTQQQMFIGEGKPPAR